jgi:hypothetical protein
MISYPQFPSACWIRMAFTANSGAFSDIVQDAIFLAAEEDSVFSIKAEGP